MQYLVWEKYHSEQNKCILEIKLLDLEIYITKYLDLEIYITKYLETWSKKALFQF